MNIHSSKFLQGVIMDQDMFYDKFPLFAVIGRSNVGKSSFINAITQRKDLAYTGAKPGVTRQVNLFLLNNKIYLADLPGYGYARLSHKQRHDLERLIFWYLDPSNMDSSPKKITKVFHLIDAKVGATELDLVMRDFLAKHKLKVIVIVTKSDKIGGSKREKSLNAIKKHFQGQKIIPFSSKTGLGKSEVLFEIFRKKA